MPKRNREFFCSNGLKVRSGLEVQVINNLIAQNIVFEYEPYKLKYEEPKKLRSYTPDVKLSFLLEIKGRLTQFDRKKHELVKEQYPNLDLRFVFGNAKNKIYRRQSNKKYKSPNLTYSEWAESHGFKWAEKTVPSDWLDEAQTRNTLYIIKKVCKIDE